MKQAPRRVIALFPDSRAQELRHSGTGQQSVEGGGKEGSEEQITQLPVSLSRKEGQAYFWMTAGVSVGLSEWVFSDHTRQMTEKSDRR